MTTMIAPTARPSRRQARTAVPSSARRAPAHLHKALHAEARKRSEQLEQPAPALDDALGHALLAAAQRTMAEVGEALNRWAEGSYGLCLRCDNEIPVARLELRPWAPHCVDCARR